MSFSQSTTSCWEEMKMQGNSELKAVTSYKNFLTSPKCHIFTDKWMLALATLGMLDSQLESHRGPLHGAQRERPLGLGQGLVRVPSLSLPSQVA